MMDCSCAKIFKVGTAPKTFDFSSLQNIYAKMREVHFW